MRGLRIPETKRARALRANAPSAEAKLWSRLRARRLGGFRFIRQEPVGPYFADFCCREEKLVIEVDGATHSTEAELARDAAREAFLMSRGYHVLRFRNAEIYEEINGVMETIMAALERRETI